MTIDELRRILASCAGENNDFRLNEDVLDTDFDDLGYDSLARMETAARIEKEYGIEIPDEQITQLHTPRRLLDFVNGILGDPRDDLSTPAPI